MHIDLIFQPHDPVNIWTLIVSRKARALCTSLNLKCNSIIKISNNAAQTPKAHFNRS